ncbi:MAG TPA: AtpZ/AtpI family protein [Pseudonocardiaceae bacterium]|nr:AtpZ/AtpI family protein [Pseudonocardiaceae bacterium]
MSQSDGPDLSTLLGFGLSIAACLVVGLGLGSLADRALDTLPVFTLLGLALGIVATCCYVYAKLKQYLKE